jgi:hypothetical protein
MLVNVLPPLVFSDVARKVSFLGLALPLAGIFMIISIASMAMGEMLASPRIYEYLGAIAPKGQEGLYLGYVNLPIALGSIISGLLGGALFEKFITTPQKSGLAVSIAPMWLIITGISVLSIIGLAVYDRLVRKTKK